ncbi:MAG: zinc-binding dehydrogenase [Thermomicrobium sp.]|nr:zinc-binding dehydrogenase [Thermomicrobium sp.]MDW8060707.1 zinc-binding dehydrogenase [Thermomicrobium sp.]
MSARMRAARLLAPGDFRLVEVSRPEPGHGEVLLRVLAAGLCHSDLHIVDGELGDDYRLPLPVTLGHEICGEVAEIGPGVSAIESGRRYVVFGAVGCGACRYCRSGRDNLCVSGQTIGRRRDGGYADFVVVPARALLPVPETVSDAEAAVATDAVLTSYHALLAVGRLRPGEGVAIIGVGGLGQSAVQIAKAFGAVVLALDTDARKRALAGELGADAVVGPQEVCPGVALLDRPVDLVVDLVGTAETFLLAQDLVARGGRIVLVGLASTAGTLRISVAARNELAVLGSAWGTREELATVLDLIARGVVRPRVETHPLVEILTWVERLRAGTVEGRVALVP